MNNYKYKNIIKVYMLPAGKGDFFILQFSDISCQHFIFIDGGDKSAAIIYKDALAYIEKTNQCIDALIFTHNDDDHICGALCALMEMSKLPDIKKIYITLGKEIERRFHLKSLAGYPELEEKEYLMPKSKQHSTKQALSLIEYFKKLKLDDRIEGCVCMGDCISIGNAQIKIISPGKRQLENYLNKWNREIKKDSDRRHTSDKFYFKQELSHYVMAKLQKDASVSNGSSIAFLFEFGEEKMAFLGDAYADVCVEGLSKFYSSTVNVDFVKIPHHGSEYNYSAELYQLLKTNCFLLSTKGTEKHPSPVFLGKLFEQNPYAKIICNSQWMRHYGFSDGDIEKYLNKKNPHIYQIKNMEQISPILFIYGKFPDQPDTK